MGNCSCFRYENEQDLNHQQCNETAVVRALYRYEPQERGDLGFDIGEEMEVEKWYLKSCLNWWSAKSKLSGHVGYIPRNFVADINSLEAQRWYFGSITRKKAEMYLSKAGTNGMYLIRHTKYKLLKYALSVYCDGSVKHYLIRSRNDKYFFDKSQLFSSLQGLINHYTVESDGLCTMLSKPCAPTTMAPVQPKIPTDPNSISWYISHKDIQIKESLGDGVFGEVYRGIWNNTTPVAVKKIKPGKMSEKEFLKEAAIMKKLRHPKLIQLYAICKTKPIYIVTEVMENGSLLEYLRDKEERGHKLNLPQLVDITSQVACGMAYLETQNYIHRDLAARNVLVGKNLECKVADFGLARDELYLQSKYSSKRDNLQLPLKWTAPEALGSQKFSIKSDVWSFGILMYEVITHGQEPYPGQEFDDNMFRRIVDEGYRMDCPLNCPNDYYYLMSKCWNEQPADRPEFHVIQSNLEHFTMVCMVSLLR